MKNNYIVRAQKFVMSIAPYIENANTVREYIKGVHEYLADHPNRVISTNRGISRFVMITADYVIKVDYNTDTDFGTCEDELNNYKYVCEAGFGEYFAEITKFTYGDKDYYIMPKIGHINEEDDDVYCHCPDDLTNFLYDNFKDMHSGNYGWKNRHPVIFDYAAS